LAWFRLRRFIPSYVIMVVYDGSNSSMEDGE
jgi:hypothetical protein